jgi:hypothetical protein
VSTTFAMLLFAGFAVLGVGVVVLLVLLLRTFSRRG